MKEVETYQDLMDALSAMTPEQRAQPIQVANSPCTDEPVELHCGVAIGTVGEFGFAGSRSIVDNKYHADDVTLLIDGNPHSVCGAVAWEMTDDGVVPVYGLVGPTDPADQRAPGPVDEIGAHIGPVCKRRLASMT